MRIYTLLNTSKSQRVHVEEIPDGEYVTFYGLDIEVPVDDDHPYGRETIVRHPFIMPLPDQDETEEELKDDIEQVYVQVDLYEVNGIEDREQIAMWRMPLDMLLKTQLPPNELRPNAMYPTRLEIEIKRFKMSSMEGK